MKNEVKKLTSKHNTHLHIEQGTRDGHDRSGAQAQGYVVEKMNIKNTVVMKIFCDDEVIKDYYLEQHPLLEGC